jgi:hypothetical protein
MGDLLDMIVGSTHADIVVRVDAVKRLMNELATNHKLEASEVVRSSSCPHRLFTEEITGLSSAPFTPPSWPAFKTPAYKFSMHFTLTHPSSFPF